MTCRFDRMRAVLLPATRFGGTPALNHGLDCQSTSARGSHRRHWSAFVVFLVIGGAATPVGAEPISTTFVVQVVGRSVGLGLEPFSRRFTLTVEFDDNITDEAETAIDRFVYYGVPTFSELPLEAPPKPQDVELRLSDRVTNAAWQATSQLTIGDPLTKYGHGAFLELFYESVIPGAFESRILLFGFREGFDVPPAMTPSLLLDTISHHRPRSVEERFNFLFEQRAGDSAAIYTGVITSEQAPIPEPGTILLLSAAGVATVCRHGIRRRGSLHRGGHDLT